MPRYTATGGLGLLTSDGTDLTLTSGQLLLPAGTNSLPSYSFSAAGNQDTGMYSSSTDVLEFTTGGTRRFLISATNMQFYPNNTGSDIILSNSTAISWAPGASDNDIFLERDAAATLAQRNSTNAQTFNIYGTITDACNYERLAIGHDGTNGFITLQEAGTGGDNADLIFTPLGTGLVANVNRTSLSNSTEGNTGRLNLRTIQEAHTLAAAKTSTTANIDVPSGALIAACSLTVNTAVTDDDGDDTWSAIYQGGATQEIAATSTAAAQNTKINKFFDANNATAIASAETNITFTANGSNFTAGVIEILVYYYDLTSMANA